MSCSGSGEPTEAIVDLEATAYEVCSIDTLGRLQCADTSGESWNFQDMVLGSNSYIELDASQTDMCALEDNDGDGAGSIHCFRIETLGLADVYDVYEGPYTSFTANGANICGIGLDGEIDCPGATADSGLDAPPAGPFVKLWSIDNSFITGVCGLTSDGGLECFGDEGFTAEFAKCDIPSSGVVDVDMGGAPFPMVLTEDGTITGWVYYSDFFGCISESVPGAVAVETGQNVVCTLDGSSAITCIDLNTNPDSSAVDEDSILENAPEGSFSWLAGNPNNIGSFMCASSGYEITCWGDGWNDGVSQTFSF